MVCDFRIHVAPIATQLYLVAACAVVSLIRPCSLEPISFHHLSPGNAKYPVVASDPALFNVEKNLFFRDGALSIAAACPSKTSTNATQSAVNCEVDLFLSAPEVDKTSSPIYLETEWGDLSLLTCRYASHGPNRWGYKFYNFLMSATKTSAIFIFRENASGPFFNRGVAFLARIGWTCTYNGLLHSTCCSLLSTRSFQFGLEKTI